MRHPERIPMTDLSRAFHELVDEVKGIERRFVERFLG